MRRTLAEHIHTISKCVRGEDGFDYEAQVYGAHRDDGTWAGWLEFVRQDASGPVLQTGQETSQPNRKALEYWAGGLEPIFLEGALLRARE